MENKWLSFTFSLLWAGRQVSNNEETHHRHAFSYSLLLFPAVLNNNKHSEKYQDWKITVNWAGCPCTLSLLLLMFSIILALPAGSVWFSSVTLEKGALAGKAGNPAALLSHLYPPYLSNIWNLKPLPHLVSRKNDAKLSQYISHELSCGLLNH